MSLQARMFSDTLACLSVVDKITSSRRALHDP
jgi:hypothetical protein